jgi:sugar phosphate isomerase/epimerase
MKASEVTALNPIYLSTGAFIGRKNNRNFRLAAECAGQLECDGFEFLVFRDFYGAMYEIAGEYTAAGLNIPVVHADKGIGDRFSNADESDYISAAEDFKRNCEIANILGAGTIVTHAWGYPESNKDPRRIMERLPALAESAAGAGLTLLVENVPCTDGDALHMLDTLAVAFPTLSFIIDTRLAHFHRELERVTSCPVWPRVRHFHVSDTKCGYKEWAALNPILQPGEGGIDWRAFFGAVKRSGYAGSFTLEAPSMLESGVDAETLNKGLAFIRDGLKPGEREIVADAAHGGGA